MRVQEERLRCTQGRLQMQGPREQQRAAVRKQSSIANDVGELHKLYACGSVSSEQYQAAKRQLLSGVAIPVGKSVATLESHRKELTRHQATEAERRAMALSLRGSFEDAEGAALLLVDNLAGRWCMALDGITVQRCEHCEVNSSFQTTANQARGVRQHIGEIRAVLTVARRQRVKSELVIGELQTMLAEQEEIINGELRARDTIAASTQQALANLAEVRRRIDEQVRTLKASKLQIIWHHELRVTFLK
jgi:hypothetical protein